VAIVQTQYEPPVSRSRAEQNPLLGFIAVIVMCITSAFAGRNPILTKIIILNLSPYFFGVYLELVLKQSSVDVWMQNIRLALFGLIISAALILLKDTDRIGKGKLTVVTYLMI
jgi:hypothetical protein